MVDTAPARPRMTWMDVLRGTAIILVVLWHAGAILLLLDVPVPRPLLFFNQMLEPYRMPTLMFLSGMLLPASLKKPTLRYYAGKLRWVAWPLVIWTVIHWAQFRHEASLTDLYFWGTAYLWFLAYLLVFYVVAPVTKWVPPWVIIALSIAATLVVHDENRRRFFYLAVFFFLGAWLVRRRDLLERALNSRWCWVAVPVAAAIGVISAITGQYHFFAYELVFSLIGVLALTKVARLVASRPFSRPLQYVGRHSLIYYVTHFPLILVVVQVGSIALGLPAIVVVASGFVLSMAVGSGSSWLSDHTPVRWAFIAPEKGDLARFRAASLHRARVRSEPGPSASARS